MMAAAHRMGDMNDLIDGLPMYNQDGYNHDGYNHMQHQQEGDTPIRIVSDCSLDELQKEKAKLENLSFNPRGGTKPTKQHSHITLVRNTGNTNSRLNKFVRRLHEMLSTERAGGIVEWRRGLLVLHDIDTFSNKVLPKYFNTQNFKTFRRQLNYYGFLHVRSFSSSSGSGTTALWVHHELADHGSNSISSVLKLKRVDSNISKTPQGRRERKHEAASSAEVQDLADKLLSAGYSDVSTTSSSSSAIPKVVHCKQQEQLVNKKNSVLPQQQDPMIDQAAGLLLLLSSAAR